jgi:hypothetical protein
LENSDRSASNGAHGYFRLTTTVDGVGAATDLMAVSM